MSAKGDIIWFRKKYAFVMKPFRIAVPQLSNYHTIINRKFVSIEILSDPDLNEITSLS